MRYAVVDANGIVTNLIILTDVAQWVGTEQIVLIAEGEWVDIGYSYDENALPRFSPPAE